MAGLFAPSVSAQSANDGFNPNVNGLVYAVAMQGDGKMVIGGEFTRVGTTTRSNIARLNLDGTVDATFNPAADFAVYALAVQTNGQIVVGGFFTTLGGQPRSRIGRLNADATLDNSFDPGANAPVDCLAVQRDGKILVGGWFGLLGGQERSYFGRLHADGSVDGAFDPGADGRVFCLFIQADGSIVLGGEATLTRINPDGTKDGSFNPGPHSQLYSLAAQADGKILVGCYFPLGGNGPPSYLNRLNADGSIDTNFHAAADDYVWALAVQPDGKIVAGGWFSNLGGERRCRIGRLNPDGSLDRAFNPGSTNDACTVISQQGGVLGVVRALALQADGKIVVGGFFTNLFGYTRNRMARLYPDGNLDATFNPAVSYEQILWNGLVNGFVVQPDHTVVVGGYFTSLGGQPRTNLGRLTADGRVDTMFAKGSAGLVKALLPQPDGKIVVLGWFGRLAGQARTNIGRLNADGTLDAGFNATIDSQSAFDSYVEPHSLAAQADGKILVGGCFNRVNGVARTNLARLHPDGSLDTTFTAGTERDGNSDTYAVQSVAVQPDGKIVIGGFFRTLAGQARTNLGRLNADGSLDEAFNTAASSFVYAVAVQADGKILVAGVFTQLGGQPRSRLGRLNPDGSVDMDFSPDVGSTNGAPYVFSFALQADGKILVGGEYTTINGQPRLQIARLAADGTLDSSFRSDANLVVWGLAIQPDGKILVGGNFNTLAAQPRSRIARLANDTPALDSLTFDPVGTEVTWRRGGSAPEIEQVSFEQSLDGTTYTALGSGGRVSGGWRLAGLALPAGQNIYIRARGRSIGGFHNGSSSLLESVAQFWRLPPPFISSVQVVDDGVFQFSFTNTNAVYFSVLASADLAMPVAEWEVLGPPVPVGGGVYQFADPGAANHPRRFYQLRAP